MTPPPVLLRARRRAISLRLARDEFERVVVEASRTESVVTIAEAVQMSVSEIARIVVRGGTHPGP